MDILILETRLWIMVELPAENQIGLVKEKLIIDGLG
jgi:hypothetical protein